MKEEPPEVVVQKLTDFAEFTVGMLLAGGASGGFAHHTEEHRERYHYRRDIATLLAKHLSLRTWCSRLVRRGIRFSKTERMHKINVGLAINVWYFGYKHIIQ